MSRSTSILSFFQNLSKVTLKIGIRYVHGKVLFYRATKSGSFLTNNPGEGVQPSWAVDIREIIAMGFAGAGSIIALVMGDRQLAEILLVGLMMYATGRTVPGGKEIRYVEKAK